MMCIPQPFPLSGFLIPGLLCLCSKGPGLHTDNEGQPLYPGAHEIIHISLSIESPQNLTPLPHACCLQLAVTLSLDAAPAFSLLSFGAGSNRVLTSISLSIFALCPAMRRTYNPTCIIRDLSLNLYKP